MAIYQRGRTWYVDFHVNGKRVQESTGTKNKREAEKIHALRISEVERGVFQRTVKITLPDFGKRYLDHAKSHKRSWLRDEQMMKHLEGFFGNVLLGDLTVLRVEEYQQSRVHEVCPATVNREHALLKHMLNMAERWNLRQGTNPARMVKFLDENNLKFQTLSAEDEQALLSKCPAYLQDMIVFALNTGLRSGDIFQLLWEEVDMEARRLDKLVQKTRQQLEVPLNDSAYEILVAWQAMKKGPYVFYNHMTGDCFRDLKASLKIACKEAGLTGITWHIFRHTFASRLIREGVDIVTAKELLGHSSVTVTMRYAHTNDEAKKAAVKKITGSDRMVTIEPKARRFKQ